MITRLKLLHFGKFEAKSFPFKAFTFFYGSNESGKTTLFDALFQELCAPKANRSYGRLLKERYGEAREAELSVDGAPLFIDEDEFMDLYAIRSGDIHFDLGSPAAYMENIKSELFSGGIDPTLLARRFEVLASRKKTYRHNQELSTLETRLRELETRLKQLREKRQVILAAEKDVLGREVELSAAEAETLRMEKRSGELEDELRDEARIAERRELEALLELLERSGQLRRELETDPAAGKDETAELDRLLEGRTRLEDRLKQSRGLAERLRLELSESSEALARLTARKESAAVLSARAGGLLARIEAHAGGPRTRRAWNRGLLLASLLLFLSGFAVGFASSSRLFQLLSALAGFFAALVTLLLARRGTTIPEVGEKDFILHLKDEYRNFSGGPRELASATLAGIGLELQKQRLEADLLAREAAEKSAAAGKLEARLRTQEAEVRALALDTENADRTVRAWLAERSVAGRDAYLSLRHQSRTRTEQLNDLEQRLATEMERRQTEDPDRLRSDCLRRLSELDKEGVPRRGKTELEIRRLETEFREQRRQLEARQAEQARLHARQAGARGRISGSLGDLPEQIMQCESELRRTGQQIAARAEERQAALLLKDIFAGLAAEAETNLSALQRELASSFSELVPASRKVALQGLETRSIRAGDAGGDSRLLPHLSRGTQDAFLLAARLALARKSGSRPGILILDEPFFALDAQRSERALGLLKRFQTDHGWQIVMLSKDEQLYALAQTLFPEGQFSSL